MVFSFRRNGPARLACLGCLLIGLFLIAAGCGSGRRRAAETADISGKVTYNGKPVTGGQVSFVAEDGFASNGIIDEQGNYTVKAPVGNVKISVNNTMLQQRPEGGKMGAGPRPNAPEPEKMKGTYVQLPFKVLTPDASGLSYTVKPGQQTFDIQIRD